MQSQDIDQIYEEYASMIYKYLRILTNNDDIAEELTQETFFRAIRKINSFKGNCKISTWLCQIAKYSWYEYSKKNNKEKDSSLDHLENVLIDFDDMEQKIINKKYKMKIYEQIQYLDEDMKNVMLLRLTGDLSFEEIGQIINKSANYARVTYYRGKQKIRKVVKYNE